MDIFVWFYSMPDSVRFGILFVIFSWIFFVITLPLIKSYLVWKWKLLDEEQCRRKQKALWKVLFWVHIVVIAFSFFGLNYVQNHSKYSGLLDKYLVYLFLLFSFCIFLQIIYEAVREHTTMMFGTDPKTPLWWKVLKPIFRAFGRVCDLIVDSFKKVFNIK